MAIDYASAGFSISCVLDGRGSKLLLSPNLLEGGWFASSGSEASASPAVRVQGLDVDKFTVARVQTHVAFFGRNDM